MGSHIIGIDLGTTSSLVAVMEGNKPKLIADAQGRTVMPSLVVIKPDRSVVVGHDADNEARKYSDENLLVASLKRSMGKNKEFGWHDSRMPAQLLIAMILAELRVRAERYLGEGVRNAVIAVPANFSFSQRQFTKEAALIAGLQPWRIVNEATAALCAIRDDLQGKVVVADLGGGTFDVSAIDFGDGVFEVRATAGDDHLGGDDFTAAISKLILEKMDSKFDPEFLRSDPITSQRLNDAAEDCKKQLSGSDVVEVKIPFVRTRTGAYHTLVCTITRKEFETVCQTHFDRIENILAGVWNATGLWESPPLTGPVYQPKKNWLNRLFFPKKESSSKTSSPAHLKGHPDCIKPAVWLIGNASRIPEIRRRLHNKYRAWHPQGMLELKEPVALGAATIAGVLQGTVRDHLLLDVTPNALGLETEGGATTCMIPKNTTIPRRHSSVFTTVRDNQTSISLKILEGESYLSRNNRVLATLQISNLPPGPAGIAKIEVCFDVDGSGLLHVVATDVVTKKTSKLTCSDLVLPQKQLNDYHQVVQKWVCERHIQLHT